MRQGSFGAVRRLVFLLIIFCLAGFSAFAQQRTVDMVSIILDPFDGSSSQEWTIGGRTYSYEFEWRLDASRFSTTSVDAEGNELHFPMSTVVPSYPLTLYGHSREIRDIRSFGIWSRFDRRGYNWIDVYPAHIDQFDQFGDPLPFEIPLPGQVQNMDMWVWGSNHNYYMEAYVRDYNGVVHIIPMGDLAFQGWRNLTWRIPNHIRQQRRHMPRLSILHFVKFRIWTTPVETVDDFYVYFNQFKILTDVFQDLFDGDDLANPVRVQEYWMQNN